MGRLDMPDDFGWPELSVVAISGVSYASFAAFAFRALGSLDGQSDSYHHLFTATVVCCLVSSLTVPLFESANILESGIFSYFLGLVLWSETAASGSFSWRSVKDLDFSSAWGPLANLSIILFVLITLPLAIERTI